MSMSEGSLKFERIEDHIHSKVMKGVIVNKRESNVHVELIQNRYTIAKFCIKFS